MSILYLLNIYIDKFTKQMFQSILHNNSNGSQLPIP